MKELQRKTCITRLYSLKRYDVRSLKEHHFLATTMICKNVKITSCLPEELMISRVMIKGIFSISQSISSGSFVQKFDQTEVQSRYQFYSDRKT